jgi:hypothetical protein
VYECITGYAAFAGENFFAVRTKILLTTPPALAKLCPEAPPALASFVGRMLAKAPADRFASAAEVATALASLGAMPGSVRRIWSTSRPPTLPPAAVLRPLPATIAQWSGIVLVAATGDVALDRVRVSVPEATVDVVEGGYVVVALPPAQAHAPLAHRLVEIAVVLRGLLAGARFVASAGLETLDELLDRSASVLEATERSAVFDQTLREAGAIHVDADIAGAVGTTHAIDGRVGLGGYRLVR